MLKLCEEKKIFAYVLFSGIDPWFEIVSNGCLPSKLWFQQNPIEESPCDLHPNVWQGSYFQNLPDQKVVPGHFQILRSLGQNLLLRAHGHDHDHDQVYPNFLEVHAKDPLVKIKTGLGQFQELPNFHIVKCGEIHKSYLADVCTFTGKCGVDHSLSRIANIPKIITWG